MADKSGIVMLNGTNYPTWKIQVKMTLMKFGVWGFVTGDEREPDEDENIVAWRKWNEQ